MIVADHTHNLQYLLYKHGTCKIRLITVTITTADIISIRIIRKKKIRVSKYITVTVYYFIMAQHNLIKNLYAESTTVAEKVFVPEYWH